MQLLAQPVHVNFYGIKIGFVVEREHFIEQLFLGYRAPLPAEEDFEYRVLARRQPNGSLSAMAAPRRRMPLRR